MGDAACSTVELAEQPMVRSLRDAGLALDCPAFDSNVCKWERLSSLTARRTSEYDSALQACCFHGTEPVVAVGLVTGQVQAFRLASNGNASTSAPVEAFTKKPHKESCRAIGFSQAGHRLYTASADG